ncbi:MULTISPECIES: dihydroxyacetone kinase subunit L [unclassified Clostridium]|jgi:dihydroxyacetone kinase-like protein|uniref:dihydroxyacetone kinase subunit L n=1 Tax=Clostridia TaxID=186801 RepID=UPI00148576DB|nr:MULTISPECIES: dihydroxyacetone kinase subunit L [unclassified Clostridium]
MQKMDKALFTAFIVRASAIMDEKKDYLIELDANLGDGDLGLTMSKGFGKAREFVEAGSDEPLAKFIMKTGMVFAQHVPSTMGTLVASALMKAGKGANGQDELDVAGVAEFAAALAQGIMERGKAKVGECTIVDSLYPAGEAFRQAAAQGLDLPSAAQKAYEAAQAGVEATKDMEPCYGKAAVFAEKSKGVVDQGAVVGMLIIEALRDACQA